MSESDSKFKQRIIGALVLVALAIIFLPMLFKSKDEPALPQTRVEAQPMPRLTEPPAFPVEEVELPDFEPVVEPPAPPIEEYTFIEHDPAPIEPVVEAPVVVEVQPAPVTAPPPASKPETPPVPAKPVVSKPEPAVAKPAPVVSQPARVEAPASWAIQLGSLGNLANAQKLRDSYQARHYTAYISSDAGVHKVFIGPLIREAEAQAMCKQLKTRDGQDCFVVRYQR